MNYKASYYSINLFLILSAVIIQLNAQGNCLLYPEHSGERIACELSYRAIEYRQGSRESQIIFDKVIEIGPNYAWAYYEKAVPFFKRGLLNEGIKLINKAIEIDPKAHICYRAYWYYSHQSYEECIADLERFYDELGGHLQFIPGGEMEMHMYLAMAYAKTGDIPKAITTVKACFDAYDSDRMIGLYDHYIMGYLYYLNNQYEDSIAAMERQISMNENLRDTYYILGKCYDATGQKEKAQKNYQECYDRMNGDKKGYTRTDITAGFTEADVSALLKR